MDTRCGNLSRSKLHKLNFTSLEGYLSKKLYLKSVGKLIFSRSSPISNIFKSVKAYTPQGRVFVRVPVSRFKVGFKMGMFAATKKPFNFRPKVKKQKR
jgi:ribosomal protein S19